MLGVDSSEYEEEDGDQESGDDSALEEIDSEEEIDSGEGSDSEEEIDSGEGSDSEEIIISKTTTSKKRNTNHLPSPSKKVSISLTHT